MTQAGGRLTSGAGADLIGFDPSQLNIEAAANALLNPQAFNFDPRFKALQGERNRLLSRALGNVDTSFGTAGARFSESAGRQRANVAEQVTQGFAQEDLAALLSDLVRTDRTRAAGLGTILDSILGGNQLQGQAALSLLAPILQFIAPGEAVIDPGLGRELITGAVGGAASAAPLLALNRG